MYSKGVKITNWYEEVLQYPLDFAENTNRGHYRTLGPTTEVFIPQTTYNESAEKGLEEGSKTQLLPHPSLISTSYLQTHKQESPTNMKSSTIDMDAELFKTQLSTYQYSFCWGKDQPKHEEKDWESPHPLFNRLPQNCFLSVSPSSEFKFMDDHLFHLTESRKWTNYMRQIRNVSFNPWLGKYGNNPEG